MRADELMEAGDMEGRAVWLRIVKAIEELLSKERPWGRGSALGSGLIQPTMLRLRPALLPP